MALITELEPQAAQQLLNFYGISLKRLTPLSAGSVNSNFLIEATDGQGYFARIYEEQGPSGAEFELLVNERLAQAGIPVALPVRRQDGGLASEHAGKPFAVYQKVTGEVLCQRRVTPGAARAVGDALARVHVASLGGLTVPEGRFGFAAIEARLGVVEAAERSDLMPAVSNIREICTRLERERRSDLPMGLTHGDLFRDNVLMSGQGGALQVAALLDFESACRGPYVYDLMVTLLAWCYGATLEEALAREMVAGYEAVRPLSADERGQMVLEGSVACVRFATTRLTDFSLRALQGEKPARDYGRFLQRLSALEGGELDRALQGR